MLVDNTKLSKWFPDNYIGKCSYLCPSNISRLFDAANTGVKLQFAVSEIAAWRLSNSLLDSWQVFDLMVYLIPDVVDRYPPTARCSVYWMSGLAKINYSRLSAHFTAVALLNIAVRMSDHQDMASTMR